MTVYWNFREILGVFPDGPGFTCVGTTKKGLRCGQSMISNANKERAGELLNAMDRCKNLKSSYEELDELAYLTLCPRWHRKPGYNQVDDVSRRWRFAIGQYEKLVKDDVYSAPGASVRRTNRHPAEPKKTARVLKDEQEVVTSKPAVSAPKSNILKQRDANISLPTRPMATKALVEGLFTSESKVSSANKVMAPSASPELKMSIAAVPSTRSEEPKVEQDKEHKVPTMPLHDFTLPKPPETLESSQQMKQDTANEIPSTPTKSSKDKTVERRSVTLTTTTITMTAETTSPTNAHALLNAVTNSVVAKPQILDDTQSPEPLFSLAADFTASPETPHKTSQITAKSKIHDYETESFGYAIVTPDAARYKTYLPAQQSHGLLTPPDTPETLPRLEINIEPFEDSFPRFAVRPVVSRKPLSVPEKRHESIAAGEVGFLPNLCSNCQDGVCHCHETIEDEEVKAGCFHGLGLRLLKKKVVRKMETLKMRASRISVKRDKS